MVACCSQARTNAKIKATRKATIAAKTGGVKAKKAQPKKAGKKKATAKKATPCKVCGARNRARLRAAHHPHG
jgi:hypothetical protein